MAAPFGLEDLEKLKSFIDFVAANPLILNLPQLGFFKKFIEKFGGVVPEGDFQMPAGGKCPFGGDVKSETKSAATPPPTVEPEEEEVEAPEMEAESEESEVELDMEDNNINIAEPNVLYLNEKPPKIVKTTKATAPKLKKPTKKKERQKTKKKLRTPRKASGKQQDDNIVKKENYVEETRDNMDANDPLFTPQVEIKCELNEAKLEPEVKLKYGDDTEVDDNGSINSFDQDYVPDEQEEGISDKEDEYTDYEDDNVFEAELQKMELSSDEDDEDEPLIMLKSSGSQKEYKCKAKTPRLINCGCKQHCNEKFTEDQRKRICAYYWNLKKPQKIDFLQKHIKSRRFTKYKFLKTDRKRKKCCNLYYLTNCIKTNDGEDILHLNSDSIKVCHKFFETTLSVSDHYLRKILSGYELELEKDLELLVETIRVNKEKELEKSQQIKQVLDPETGNLIIIDPKEKKKKYKMSSAESKPKEKRKRRRPGDPNPEHFPKPINCSVRCLYKCHTKFTEQERKQMCDTFWSMDFKHRKDYVLANIEVKDTLKQVTPEFRTTNRPPRAYQTRCFLRAGLQGEKMRVCKHFMTNTLCTNKNFISDAIEYADKNTGYYTKADRRGHQPVPNRISADRTQLIVDHIKSYPTWVPNKKSKIKYLHHSLTIKTIFNEYLERCEKENIQPVGRHYFYRYYHKNFRLLFLTTPVPRKGCLNQNPNLSRYTGEEPGGFWLDPTGERLDIRLFNPAKNMHTFQTPFNKQHEQNFSMASNSSQDSFTANITNTSSSLQLNPLNYTTSATAHHLANFIDPTLASSSTFNPRAVAQSSLGRLDLNPNLYDNLPHASSSSMFRML